MQAAYRWLINRCNRFNCWDKNSTATNTQACHRPRRLRKQDEGHRAASTSCMGHRTEQH